MLAAALLVVEVAVPAFGGHPRGAEVPALPFGVLAMEPHGTVGVDYGNRPLAELADSEHDEVLDDAGGAGGGRCCHVEQVT